MESDSTPQSQKPAGTPPPRQFEQPLSQQEAERRARVDYLRSVAQPKRRGSRKGLKIVLIVLLILAMLAAVGAVYWFVIRKPASNGAGQAQSSASQQETATKVEATSAKLTHRDYAPLNMGVDYPDTWKANEEGGKLTLTSTAMAMKTASGASTKGQLLITFQAKQTTLPDFKDGNAVAVLPSEKIKYSKPTQSQRAETYMSFLKYANSTSNGLDVIYVTGDAGYQKDQAIPLVDVVRGDPLLSVRFLKCATEACGGTGTAMSLSPDVWTASSSLVTAVKAVLTSLTVL